MLFKLQNISKAFDEKVLFEGVSFGLAKGDRVALVAKNGAGKSTIFKKLSKIISCDEIRQRRIIFFFLLLFDPQVLFVH